MTSTLLCLAWLSTAPLASPNDTSTPPPAAYGLAMVAGVGTSFEIPDGHGGHGGLSSVPTAVTFLPLRWMSVEGGIQLLTFGMAGARIPMVLPLPALSVTGRLGPRASPHSLIASAGIYLPLVSVGYEYFDRVLLLRLQVGPAIDSLRPLSFDSVQVAFTLGRRFGK